jgi:hypothetical protein
LIAVYYFNVRSPIRKHTFPHTSLRTNGTLKHLMNFKLSVDV